MYIADVNQPSFRDQLFGATHVMRSPQDSNKHNIFEVYTNERFARQTNQMFSPTGFIFIAVMCGGDYDLVGLHGFGRSMAEALASGPFAFSLYHGAMNLSGNDLRNYLVTWIDLGLSARISQWLIPMLPNTVTLALLCDQYFGWGPDILNRLSTNVWDGYFIQQLAQASISCLELPDGTNFGPDTIWHITSVDTKISTSSMFPSYRVEAFLGTLPVDVLSDIEIVADSY
ncbi:hypothetical protein BYT27DRAFT_7209119 [Phlegmacium glaucopus]|nr:hypothetical protein BYT27DRAFT_7209119 [Phlegmacium glaucopus]